MRAGPGIAQARRQPYAGLPTPLVPSLTHSISTESLWRLKAVLKAEGAWLTAVARGIADARLANFQAEVHSARVEAI